MKLNSALSDLGWVELRCPICLANCSDDLVFFLGIIGIQCHMSKKHEMTPTNKSDFSHKSIVEKGVIRTHSEDIIDKFRAAMANGQDPIERFQGCFPDAAPRNGRSFTQSSHTNRADESVPSSAPGQHSNLDASDQRDANHLTLDGQPILFNDQCGIICFHDDRGSFQIFCAICEGNAVKDTTTNELKYLRGPLGLYSHLRQAHVNPLFDTLAEFEKSLLDRTSPFIKRDLHPEEADRLSTVTTLQEDVIPKIQVAVNARDSPDNFLYLNLDHPTVVVREDGDWVDLRCPVVGCGANCTSTGRKRKAAYFKGISGLEQHLRKSHDIHAPAGTAKWQWLVQECTRWTEHPVVDIRSLKVGDIPKIIAPDKEELEDTGDFGLQRQDRYV